MPAKRGRPRKIDKGNDKDLPPLPPAKDPSPRRTRNSRSAPATTTAAPHPPPKLSALVHDLTFGTQWETPGYLSQFQPDQLRRALQMLAKNVEAAKERQQHLRELAKLQSIHAHKDSAAISNVHGAADALSAMITPEIVVTAAPEPDLKEYQKSLDEALGKEREYTPDLNAAGPCMSGAIQDPDQRINVAAPPTSSMNQTYDLLLKPQNLVIAAKVMASIPAEFQTVFWDGYLEVMLNNQDAQHDEWKKACPKPLEEITEEIKSFVEQEDNVKGAQLFYSQIGRQTATLGMSNETITEIGAEELKDTMEQIAETDDEILSGKGSANGDGEKMEVDAGPVSNEKLEETLLELVKEFRELRENNTKMAAFVREPPGTWDNE